MASITQRGPTVPFHPVTPEGEGGLWTPQQKRLVTGNYVSAYLNTPSHLRQYGADFFPGWNEDAQHLGEVTGLGPEAGAAIVAHLSPANESEKNRIQGLQLVHGVGDRAAKSLIRAGEHAYLAKSAQSSGMHARRRGDVGAASRFESEHAAESAENMRLRKRGGINDTPLGMLGSREIAKALRVRGGEYEHPLESLGEFKLSDFGHTVFDPTWPRITLDTHMHDAGINRRDIPYQGPGSERGLTARTRVEHFQGSAESARNIVNRQTGQELHPSEFMGGIWFGHQQRKVDENPAAMRARRSVETQLGKWRESPLSRQFFPENYGLRPSFGKIDTRR